jgi:hypothetical protein
MLEQVRADLVDKPVGCVPPIRCGVPVSFSGFTHQNPMLMVCGADYLDSLRFPLSRGRKSRRQGMEGIAGLVTGFGPTGHAGSSSHEYLNYIQQALPQIRFNAPGGQE